MVLTSFKIYHDLQVSSLAYSIRVLANMEEPVGRVLKRTEVRKWSIGDIHLITLMSLMGDYENVESSGLCCYFPLFILLVIHKLKAGYS